MQASTWTWQMQLQMIKTSDGKSMAFARTCELPTLPDSNTLYYAADLVPGIRMLMKLHSQVVFPGDARTEAVFMLDNTSKLNAAERSSEYLTPLFEAAGWERIA